MVTRPVTEIAKATEPIRIPSPCLVVMCGPAASGKTTLACRFFPETAVVSSDRCRAMIADDEGDLSVSHDAFQLLYTILRRRLKHGRLAVADSTALSAQRRRRYIEIGREFGVPVVLIILSRNCERLIEWDSRRDRRVGPSAIRAHCGYLARALETVSREGFDAIYLVEDDTFATVQIAVDTSV